MRRGCVGPPVPEETLKGVLKMGKYTYIVEEARKDFEAGLNWMDFSNKYFGIGNPYVPKDQAERKEFLASPEYKQVQDWKFALEKMQPEVDAPDREIEWGPNQEEPGYNGKILVRVPKTLHRALVEEAKREGVSLNQLCLAKLARSL